MNKAVVGMAIGGVLGLFDGLSAWAYPEARTMMAAIVAGSVVKGIVTGLAVGAVARRWRSAPLEITVGVIVGTVLSSLAAAGQPDHYWAIVLPGMLLGAITGYVTQRYGTAGSGETLRPPALTVAFVLLAAAAQSVSAQPPEPASGLKSLEFFLGRWEGTAEGRPGKGAVSREYTALLQSKIVESRHHGVYPPQPANPKGEVHEDIGIYSFDTRAKVVRFRSFTLRDSSCTTCNSPNSRREHSSSSARPSRTFPRAIAAGKRTWSSARTNSKEIFELAEPGQDFKTYSRTRLTRAK